MTLSGDIVLHERGEAPPCPKDNISTKKVHIRFDPTSAETNSRDKNSTKDENMAKVDDVETTKEAKGDKDANPRIWGSGMSSFRDKLTNTLHSDRLTEEFEVKEEDVLFKAEDGIPIISISYRVQNSLSRSMKNYLVI